jgi:hypothetical protein
MDMISESNMLKFPVFRKLLSVFIACNFMMFLTVCSPGPSGDEPSFVFENISTVDAVNGLRTGQSVVITGNKIIDAGPAEDVQAPTGATLIDGSGKYMIPGLWDAHVHITNTEALRPAMFPLFIVNGITYVRDTSATFDTILPMRERAREASQSNGMAPQVYISGPHIESEQISWASSVSAVSPEDAAAIADSLISKDIDEIKLYELLPRDIYAEVLSIANEKGYNVSAHVPLSMDVVEASEAGLASMEHMQNLELSCSSDWETLLKSRQEMIAEGAHLSGNEMRGSIHRAQRLHAIQTFDEERCEIVIQALAANNTWQVPTLTITTVADHRLFASDDWRDTFRYLPETVRLDWEERAVSMTEQEASEEDSAYAEWAYNIIPKLAEAGVGIMAGTDMPLALLTPGFSLHEELVMLVDAGLTPMQVLEAATLRPAQYFGLENEQGSISRNMIADVVILDGNPLDDISNTQRINAVMRNGHLHTRDDLDSILAQLEENGEVLSD